ncbi:MAG: hypothetical protein JXM79_05595, partial [Sedimentisphaerales bacterium]|nr:hypothetical protein [Sedimentisphaerales bacterium]
QHNDSKELKEQPGNYLEKISRSYNLVIQSSQRKNRFLLLVIPHPMRNPDALSPHCVVEQPSLPI